MGYLKKQAVAAGVLATLTSDKDSLAEKLNTGLFTELGAWPGGLKGGLIGSLLGGAGGLGYAGYVNNKIQPAWSKALAKFTKFGKGGLKGGAALGMLLGYALGGRDAFLKEESIIPKDKTAQ